MFEEEIYLGFEKIFENIQDIKSKYLSRKRPLDVLIVTYMVGYKNHNTSAEYL